MDLTLLPFNQLIGLRHCACKTDSLLTLPDDPKYLNHLGTVHASALYSLAEASGGQFLVNNAQIESTNIIPVLRRAEIKYRKPAQGVLYSKGIYKVEDWDSFHETFAKKNRALLKFQVDILNEENVVVAIAMLEWFIAEASK